MNLCVGEIFLISGYDCVCVFIYSGIVLQCVLIIIER